MKTRIPFCLVLALVCVWLPSRVRGVELRAVLREEASGLRIEYRSGDQLVGRSPADASAGVQLKQPGEEWMAVRLRTREERDGVIHCGALLAAKELGLPAKSPACPPSTNPSARWAGTRTDTSYTRGTRVSGGCAVKSAGAK